MEETLPDLWQRLARLDQRCHIVAMSQLEGERRRGWIVRVYAREGDSPPLVEMRGRNLAGPLMAAVLAVEQRDQRGLRAG